MSILIGATVDISQRGWITSASEGIRETVVVGGRHVKSLTKVDLRDGLVESLFGVTCHS